jgi:hypothetical protein
MVYGYKRTAQALGLTRDQVQQVILTATKHRSGNQMTSFNPNDSRVKSAKSVYEDRDLSEYSTDAEKIAHLQDENRLSASSPRLTPQAPTGGSVEFKTNRSP